MKSIQYIKAFRATNFEFKITSKNNLTAWQRWLEVAKFSKIMKKIANIEQNDKDRLNWANLTIEKAGILSKVKRFADAEIDCKQAILKCEKLAKSILGKLESPYVSLDKLPIMLNFVTEAYGTQIQALLVLATVHGKRGENLLKTFSDTKDYSSAFEARQKLLMEEGEKYSEAIVASSMIIDALKAVQNHYTKFGNKQKADETELRVICAIEKMGEIQALGGDAYLKHAKGGHEKKKESARNICRMAAEIYHNASTSYMTGAKMLDGGIGKSKNSPLTKEEADPQGIIADLTRKAAEARGFEAEAWELLVKIHAAKADSDGAKKAKQSASAAYTLGIALYKSAEEGYLKIWTDNGNLAGECEMCSKEFEKKQKVLLGG